MFKWFSKRVEKVSVAELENRERLNKLASRLQRLSLIQDKEEIDEIFAEASWNELLTTETYLYTGCRYGVPQYSMGCIKSPMVELLRKALKGAVSREGNSITVVFQEEALADLTINLGRLYEDTTICDNYAKIDWTQDELCYIWNILQEKVVDMKKATGELERERLCELLKAN